MSPLLVYVFIPSFFPLSLCSPSAAFTIKSKYFYSFFVRPLRSYEETGKLNAIVAAIQLFVNLCVSVAAATAASPTMFMNVNFLFSS